MVNRLRQTKRRSKLASQLHGLRKGRTRTTIQMPSLSEIREARRKDEDMVKRAKKGIKWQKR